MSKLKHCPFCGKFARIWEGPDYFKIACSDFQNCASEVGPYDTESEAISAWNRRANPSTQYERGGGSVSCKPEIVCLCGPLRFMDAFRQAEYDLEMQGRIVVAPSFLPGSKTHDGTTGCTQEQKIALDELHKRKIDICDSVLVLNVGGYIGNSTRSEIDYAKEHNKPISYLEPMPASPDAP